ncbi:MAG: hypothetical protein FWH48_03660 [Oscillospiraceae bacterium]|nr:hypothetical protein [Oscillospiraceae bacterium]
MFSNEKLTHRQRFLNVMEYKSVDKVPNIEVGAWGQTIKRWEDEGLDLAKVHFNWWIGEPNFSIDPREYINIDYRMRPYFEYELLEKTDRYEIFRDALGVVHKALIEGTTLGTRMCMDQYLSFPVEKPEDFKEMKKRHIATPDRYPPDFDSKIEDWKNCEVPLILAHNCQTLGYYWRMREWMGTEGLSYAWYDYPALCHEMCEFITDFTIEVSKPALSHGIAIDYVMINEDLSMKTGPLLSPDTYKKFVMPQMRRLVDFFKSNGVKYVFVDTDGNCEALISTFMDCGVDGLWPLERVAEMDPIRLRKEYGRDLRLYGGVDKMRIALGKKEIDRHLGELLPLIEEGGFIPTVDHTVSPEISLADFYYYLERKNALLSGKF